MAPGLLDETDAALDAAAGTTDYPFLQPSLSAAASPTQLTFSLPGTESLAAAEQATARAARVKAARKASALVRKATETAYPLILTCPACGSLVARQTRRLSSPEGVIQYEAVVAAHSSHRSSFNLGDNNECFGSGYPGLEYSIQGVVDLYTKKDALAKALMERRTRLMDPDLPAVVDIHGRFTLRAMPILRGTPHFAAALRAEIADIEVLHRQITVDAADLRTRLLAWLAEHPKDELPKPTIRTGYTRAHHDPTRELARRGADAPASAAHQRAVR